MRLVNDGLTLWYATPDAPAPNEEGASRVRSSLVLGTSPPSPANRVAVHYRINGGPARSLMARETGTDHVRRGQYFRATFPVFAGGEVVEYGAQLTCAGRQVPSPHTGLGFPSRFTVEEREEAPFPLGPASEPPVRHFSPHLQFVGTVSTKFSGSFEVIGETPVGLRINYYLDGGHVKGPRLNGSILPRGVDHLLIRRDGVASLQVHAVFKTHDEAMVQADYYGMMDLGEDGHARALRGEFPQTAPLQIAPRFMTGDGRYAWMNRLQFLGVGAVRRPEGEVQYDIFAVSTVPADPGDGCVVRR